MGVTMSDSSAIEERIARAEAAVGSLRTIAGEVSAAMAAVRGVARGGGTVLTCGNGGSAAHAMHLAEELVGKYRAPRRPYPAVCLNADPTALTCIANDFGFGAVFARPVEAMAGPGDCVVAISTSGNSGNIVAALRVARERGAVTIGLLGKDGGEARALCDHALVVPMGEAETLQEAHQVLVHLLVEAVEAAG